MASERVRMRTRRRRGKYIIYYNPRDPFSSSSSSSNIIVEGTNTQKFLLLSFSFSATNMNLNQKSCSRHFVDIKF
jgi:hypothetical protein